MIEMVYAFENGPFLAVILGNKFTSLTRIGICRNLLTSRSCLSAKSQADVTFRSFNVTFTPQLWCRIRTFPSRSNRERKLYRSPFFPLVSRHSIAEESDARHRYQMPVTGTPKQEIICGHFSIALAVVMFEILQMFGHSAWAPTLGYISWSNAISNPNRTGNRVSVDLTGM